MYAVLGEENGPRDDSSVSGTSSWKSDADDDEKQSQLYIRSGNTSFAARALFEAVKANVTNGYISVSIHTIYSAALPRGRHLSHCQSPAVTEG